MRFGQKKSSTGEIDGGESRGVRMGERDTGAPPVGPSRQSKDPLLEENEVLIDEGSPLEDLDEFPDDGDSSPGDRRRDPLRRGI